MARPVRRAQPRERILEQAQPAGLHQGLAGVVAGEPPRLRNARGGAHAASGTRTVIAPASIFAFSIFVGFLAPPSSS